MTTPLEFRAVVVAYNKWTEGVVAVRYVTGTSRLFAAVARQLAEQYHTRWAEALIIERV